MLQSVVRRARSTSRRAVVAGAALACVVTAGAAVQASSPAQSAPAAVAAAVPFGGFTIQLGPEERVYGPSGLTDFPYFSERTPSGTLVGFISNNDSYRVATRNNKSIHAPRKVLPRGRIGSFDKCGAWLIGSIYKRGSRWVAMYHAESAGKGDNNRCIYNDDSVVASIGRAVSHDAGKTWKKTGQVLTQNRNLTTAKSEDATMGRMIQVGDFLYLFYGASTANSGAGLQRKLHVARSHVDDLGARGTWRKWHCYQPALLQPRRCDFEGTGNEGLGGRSSPIAKIDPMARVIMPNTYVNKYVALAATGTKGFKLWISNFADTAPPVDPEDPAAETKFWDNSIDIYPPVSSPSDGQVDNWNRTRRAKQLYAYPSIVGARGESHTSGQVFYIYYVKLFPGAGFPERYLMRRKLIISPEDSGLNRVALTTYLRKSDGRRRTSTEKPLDNAFRPKAGESYLLAKPRSGWVDVFECVRNGTYRLRTEQCASTERNYRRVGWIRPSAGDGATVPIYVCYRRSSNNHWATDDATCGTGARRAGLLGYGLPGVPLT